MNRHCILTPILWLFFAYGVLALAGSRKADSALGDIRSWFLEFFDVIVDLLNVCAVFLLRMFNKL
jgi:hypothetical protein